MGSYFKFFFKQGVHNIRRSVLILLGISLSVMVLSGMAIYVNSAQFSYLNSSLDTMEDYNFFFRNSLDRFEYEGANYYGYFDPINSVVSEASVSYEGSYEYDFFDFPELALVKNYSDVPIDQRDGRTTIEYLNAYFAIYDYDFYDSARFKEFFKVIDGTTPISSSEMLVDYATYQRLNLTIGSPLDIDTKFWFITSGHDAYQGASTPITNTYPLHDFLMENVTISGVYLAKKTEFEIVGVDFKSSQQMFLEVNKEDIPLLEQDHLPVLTGYDYKNSSAGNDHFFIQHIDEIAGFLAQKYPNRFSFSSRHILVQYHGILFDFPRSSIRPRYMNSLQTSLTEDAAFVQYKIRSDNLIPMDDLYVINFLLFRLASIHDRFESIKLELQIINIPIIIFAAIIGNIGFTTKIKSRKEEFLLFRSKGMSNSILNILIFVEIIFNSVFIFILGVSGGLAFFEMFKYFLTDYLSISSDLLITLAPGVSSFVTTLVYSFVLTFLSTISTLLYVNRMKSDKILAALGEGEMEVIYDEKSLFGKKEEQDQQAEDHKKKYQKYYEKKVDIFESKVSFSSKVLIFVGILPLLPYIIVLIGNTGLTSDIMLDVVSFIQTNSFIFESLNLITPIFLVLGIVKAVILDKPSRFARLGSWMSKPFLKSRNFICGLELVRRKQFRNLVLILTLFSSVLAYTNFYTTTSINQSIIEENLDIGADVRTLPARFGIYLDDLADIQAYENHMISSFENKSIFSINNIMFLYRENIYLNEIGDYVQVIYLDLEEYQKIIGESDKFRISSAFTRELDSIIKFNNNLDANTTPAGLVTPNLLDDLSINKKLSYDLNITHEFFRNGLADQEIVEISLDFKVDVIPGLYSPFTELVSDQTYETKFIMIDTKFITHTNNSMISTDYVTLFDMEYHENPIDEAFVREQIRNHSLGYIYYDTYHFYDHKWNDFNFQMMPTGVEKLYGIFHFEAILIGLLMSFGLAIILLAFQEKNKYFNGILLARGFGKSGIRSLIVSEMTVLFMIAFIIGSVLSGLLAFITFCGKSLLYPALSKIGVFFFMDPLTLFGLYGLILLLSFGLYFLAYSINARQSISRYFHKF